MVFDIIQLIGGTILVVGYIPQMLQMYRTKSVEDLNLKTFGALTFGLVLMEAYGIDLVVARNAGLAFLVTNTAGLLTLVAFCLMIIYYRRLGARR